MCDTNLVRRLCVSRGECVVLEQDLNSRSCPSKVLNRLFLWGQRVSTFCLLAAASDKWFLLKFGRQLKRQGEPILFICNHSSSPLKREIFVLIICHLLWPSNLNALEFANKFLFVRETLFKITLPAFTKKNLGYFEWYNSAWFSAGPYPLWLSLSQFWLLCQILHSLGTQEVKRQVLPWEQQNLLILLNYQQTEGRDLKVDERL